MAGIAAILIGSVLYGMKLNHTPEVTITQVEDQYQLRFNGMEYSMSHDFISLFTRQQHAVTYTLTVPRVTGEVSGSEVPVKPGSYRHAGSITFGDTTMTVNLYFEDTDHHRKIPNQLNGVYKISWN